MPNESLIYKVTIANYNYIPENADSVCSVACEQTRKPKNERNEIIFRGMNWTACKTIYPHIHNRNVKANLIQKRPITTNFFVYTIHIFMFRVFQTFLAVFFLNMHAQKFLFPSNNMTAKQHIGCNMNQRYSSIQSLYVSQTVKSVFALFLYYFVFQPFYTCFAVVF